MPAHTRNRHRSYHTLCSFGFFFIFRISDFKITIFHYALRVLEWRIWPAKSNFFVSSVSLPQGESNVYTLGNIGAHRIVSTKLPSVGSTREALTAAGNTTTRLLGTFQKVDYVFIVGVAGGVPHFTDYNKHVRLGDVVVSAADQSRTLNG